MHLDKELYKAAIYLRISRDDEDKSESDSIQNQRDLLKAFIDKDPQIELIDEFVDDGYTGTNFDRPGFMKMMEMVQNDCINCIIVKDLSRLGRNYIETGKYIDKIFPMAGVRFISVNDNYDSCRGFNDADQIVIPFKNLINDSYCRDISMKIRSQLDIKRKNGKFIGAWAGYGYKKDPNDKTHLIIDEPAAEIVKLIFNMKLEGYSASKIADYLNEMGVLTPLQYKRSLGMNCNVGYWKGDNPHWVSPMVGRILKNELYIGNLAQGKCRKINYKVKKNVPVDESEWIKVAGTHEPIVSRAVFDAVQRVLARDTRTSPHEEKVGIFSVDFPSIVKGFSLVPICAEESFFKYFSVCDLSCGFRLFAICACTRIAPFAIHAPATSSTHNPTVAKILVCFFILTPLSNLNHLQKTNFYLSAFLTLNSFLISYFCFMYCIFKEISTVAFLLSASVVTVGVNEVTYSPIQFAVVSSVELTVEVSASTLAIPVNFFT